MMKRNSTHKNLPRLYVGAALSSNVSLLLDLNHSHYLSTVLRKKVDQELLLFNGREGEWLARINVVSKKQVSVLCIKCIRPQNTPEDIWLGFSPIKKHRQDYLVEKTTELGVSHLVPLKMTYTQCFSF